MNGGSKEKTVDWVGSSLDDLKSFPTEVQEAFGFELWQVQIGENPKSVKALKGKGLSGVIELKKNFDGNTYRTVYIAKLANKIYVLHCFQKKSKSGVKTPKADIELIKTRLKIAVQDNKGVKK